MSFIFKKTKHRNPLRMRIIAHLVFLFSFTYSAMAQDNFSYAALNIPEILQENAYEVIRLGQEKFTVSSPGKAIYSSKQIITILDQKSQAKRLFVHYSPDRKIIKLKARIYDALGQIVKEISKKDIKDRSSVSDYSIYDDDRVKVIDFFHNTYPFTIEYEMAIAYQGIHFYPEWNIQGYRTAVELASFELELPPDIDISYRAFNTDLQPKISTTAIKRYRWKASHQKAIIPESYTAGSSASLPWIAILPHSFEVEGYQGSMKDWQSYGAFMHQLNEGRDQLSPEMIAKVKALTADAKTNAEKIAILYNFLQKNTRYVSVQLGIGGWQTFDAKYVEKNKYGDCKALTNFMKSMLLETGIEAYPTLICTGSDNFPIPDDLAMPYFNHVILNIPAEDIWLECTSSDYPPNYIGFRNADRNVLRYSEKGGELIRTPKSTAEDNKAVRQIEITLTSSGAATIVEKASMSGALHEYHRYYATNVSVEDQKKDFLNDTPLPSCTIEEWTLDADPTKASVQRHCQLSVPKYASRAGKRFFVPLNNIHPFTDIPKAMKGRKTPIHIDLAYTHEDNFTFNLPEGYEIESYPQEPIELKSPYGNYLVKVALQEGKLHYHRKLWIESGDFPAKEYDQVRAFYKEIAKKDGIKMVLNKKIIKHN